MNLTPDDDVLGGSTSAFGAATAGRVDAPFAWRFVVPIGLVLLILLVFMPALDAGLVDWDDDDLLFYNVRHQTLDAESLRWMFTTSYAGHFQPLTWLTYAMDWTLWKREYFGYHLTSVLLHALTTVAFYFVARRLLAAGHGVWYDTVSAPVVLSAALAAALFAVHPLRTESVTWLAARSGILAGLFYVLSVACYLRYAGRLVVCPSAESSSSRSLFYIGAVIWCALSLLAKASAVTLPVVLLILDVYPLRRFRGDGRVTRATRDFSKGSYAAAQREDTGKPHWPAGPNRFHARVWIEKMPFVALALLGGVWALIARQEGGALYTLAEHDVLARLAQACYGLTFYLWKTLLPTHLGPLYEIPPREVLFGPMLWISVTVVVSVVLVSVRLRRRWPAVPAALIVYVVVLIPVLGIVQSGPQLVADRYSYLPSLALAVIVGAGLLRFIHAAALRRKPNGRAVVTLLSVLVVTALSWATFHSQADTWLSALTLWARGVQVSPNSAIAHTNYADALVRAESFADAAGHYDRALELNPDDPVALHHFANLHARFGRTDEAIRYYLQSLRIDPNRAGACFSLARLLVGKGRTRQAVDVLRDGARRHPDAINLIDYLARLLSTHPDETVRNGEEAVRWATHVSLAHHNDNAQALLALATAYAEAGRFDKAVDAGEQAIELARRNGDNQLSAECEHRLILFREGKPYHFGE